MHEQCKKRGPANLVICSDGTGNRAGKDRGTNVWRLYEALDRQGQNEDKVVQLATHDDGVGTSDNKILRILGGAFGLGLASNVRELYTWLAKTYQPGDKIYVFGFSRGAFTARCVAGMIARYGVIDIHKEPKVDLCGLVHELWGKYKIAQKGSEKSKKEADEFKSTHGALAADGKSNDVQIEFVGIWDSVDAYGLPIDEAKECLAFLTRWLVEIPGLNRLAITRFKDSILAKQVKSACHALALDDRRRTFSPDLWNEDSDDNRITQVWFTGMHSDVGGGYVRRSLSLEPLYWILQQAKAKGLVLIDSHIKRIEEERDPLGPMHDSRAGLGIFYRYCARDVERLCADKQVNVRVHASVVDRISNTNGLDAPTNLPCTFKVEGTPTNPNQKCLEGRQQSTVDGLRGLNWWRRVAYAALLCWTGLVAWSLASMPESAIPKDFKGDSIWNSACVIFSQIGECPVVAILLTLAGIGLFYGRRHLLKLSQQLRQESWGYAKISDTPKWLAWGESCANIKVPEGLRLAYGFAATLAIIGILVFAYCNFVNH